MACLIDALNNELVRLISKNPKEREVAFGVYINQFTNIKKSITKIEKSTKIKENYNSVNMYSKSNDLLAKALTNVTYKEYQIDTVPGFIKPEKNSRHALSAEGWYKANQSLKTHPELAPKEALEYDMKMMQSVIEAKLKQYPELVQQITNRGGKAFIENSEHTVGTKGSRWEGKGLKSNFIKVLSKAYESVSTTASNIKNVIDLIAEYNDEWSAVMGDLTGYVGEHNVTYTRNNRHKFVTLSGEFWNQILDNKIEFNSLKRAIEKNGEKLTEAQQKALDKVLRLTAEEIETIKANAEAAFESNYNNALAAGEIYYDVEMSPEALTEVTGFNDKYIKDNKVKLEQSDTFEYDPDTGVIQVDKSVPEAEYQTLLKHEILHHLTYENITKNLSGKVKDKLITEAQNVRDYIEDKFGTTLEGNIAYQRLNYALEQVKSRGKDVQVAEIVAIVGAEKQIKDMLSDIANTSILETLIKRLLNSVMELLGNDKKAAESAKYVLDGVDQIIKNSKQTSELDTTKQIQGTIHLKDRAKVEAKYLEKLENC